MTARASSSTRNARGEIGEGQRQGGGLSSKTLLNTSLWTRREDELGGRGADEGALRRRTNGGLTSELASRPARSCSGESPHPLAEVGHRTCSVQRYRYAFAREPPRLVSSLALARGRCAVRRASQPR